MPPGRIVSATRPAPMRWWMTLSDDHHRHDLQGAGSRRSRTASSPAITPTCVAPSFHGINPKTSRVLHRQLRAARRRLGRQEDRGRRVGDGLHQRRRHPQRPERAGRGEIPDRGRALSRSFRIPAAPAAIAAGSASSATCARAAPITVNTQSDRAHCPPWGLDGGGDATGNEVAFRLGGDWKTDFPNAKVLVAQLKPGDAFRISLGRRRRLRRAVRAAGRGRARGRAAGLCVGEGRGGALRRGGRCRDVCGRSGGDRTSFARRNN